MESEENKTCKIIDVKIFPNRFLKVDTSEKILNKIYELEGILRVIVHGPGLPEKISYGPAKGLEVNHKDRKIIQIKGNEIELKQLIGEIIITVNVDYLNDFLNNIEDILEENLRCKYMLMIGIFTKIKATISDNLKYGIGFESSLDERYIGMVDPNAESSQSVKIIK